MVVALRNVVGVGGNFLSWAACEGEPSDEDFDTGELIGVAALLVAATDDAAATEDADPFVPLGELKGDATTAGAAERWAMGAGP
jgi:hypothetical protein